MGSRQPQPVTQATNPAPASPPQFGNVGMGTIGSDGGGHIMPQGNPFPSGFNPAFGAQPYVPAIQQAPMIPMNGQGWTGGSGKFGPVGMGTIGSDGGGHIQMGIGSNGGTTNFVGGSGGRCPTCGK